MDILQKDDVSIFIEMECVKLAAVISRRTRSPNNLHGGNTLSED